MYQRQKQRRKMMRQKEKRERKMEKRKKSPLSKQRLISYPVLLVFVTREEMV